MMAKFIDLPVFQRLRSIKQLGTAYYVWAGNGFFFLNPRIGFFFITVKHYLDRCFAQPIWTLHRCCSSRLTPGHSPSTKPARA
ncbi:hypothetical protein BT96DRAFT_925343 [Gymnopus androsaceus JB14]|uniref:Uncharacterized protein n=1 Tax=Gymnopus androsaceus JB14 TaxID=1447944 RepID=A0A6A4H0Y1_9AGAR|nr:hypothetical protein BT96DRAFT_925343 [Gymnopus androsaceus JB14]